MPENKQDFRDFAETPQETMTDDEKLDQFKLDIATDANDSDNQRENADEDMRFVSDQNGQWEGFREQQFQDRVRLQFDITSDYLNRFIGEWTLNRVGVEYKPDDMATSDEDAELLNGIYRADFRQFGGETAVDNAVQEAATCGYGAFKIATFYEDDEDEENDNQRIEHRPIYNAYNTTYWDISAQRIDKRDARWCTELKEFTRSSFLAKYPNKNPVSAYTPDITNNQDFLNTRGDRVFIATRYDAIRRKAKVFVYNNLKTDEVERYDEEDHELIKDELARNEFTVFVKERKIIRQFIEKTVFSGDEILSATVKIAGRWIPIIPVFARRGYVGGLEKYSGLVTKLKDPQRMFNMQISQLAENAASAGQTIPIFTPDQMTGRFAADWADKNNKPYLLANPAYDDAGNMIATGPTGYLQPQQIDQSTSALMQIVPQHIQGVTGGVPQDTLDPNISGKAINALIKRANLNTQSIMDNISKAIRWSGEIFQAIAADVYSSERMMRVVGQDGRESSVLLMKTVLDEETGRLIASNNLRGKRFRSVADVGPAYDTLREQTTEELKGILDTMIKVPAAQQYVPVILGALLENTAGVGLEGVKELNRKNQIIMGTVKPETDEEKALFAKSQEPKGPDPQEALVAAAAEQQKSEARNLDSKSLANAADAEKKQAETSQIITDTQISKDEAGLDQANTLSMIRERVMKTAQAGL